MKKKGIRALLRMTAAKIHNKPELMYTQSAWELVRQYGHNKVSLDLTENGYFAPSCYVNGRKPSKEAEEFVDAWLFLNVKFKSLDQPLFHDTDRTLLDEI